MEVGRSHELMVGRRMVLAKIVALVDRARTPKNVKLTLGDTILDPVKAHVNGLGTTLTDVVVGDANGSAVVSLHRSGRLGVTKLLETNANGLGILAVVEGSGKFSFRSTGKHFLGDLAQNMDGTVG